MYLYAAVNHMGGDRFADIALSHHGRRDPHGKQRVGILSEYLAVEEISPPAQDLSGQKAVGAAVQDPERADLFDPAEAQDGQDACYDPSVDGKAASPDIEDLDGVILIHVPHEDHIVDPGAQDRKGQEPDRKVPDGIRIMARLFCDMGGQGQPQQHAGGNDDPVHGYIEAQDRYSLGNVPKINAKMRKGNIH